MGMGEGPTREKVAPKEFSVMGEGPTIEKVAPKEFSVICFKCGLGGHVSKLCKFNINPCSITTCNSYKHNIEGHKAMEKLGKTVLPGKVTSAGVATPVDITTPGDALKKTKKVS